MTTKKYPQIGVRVTPTEKQILEKKADSMGITVSEYVKYVLFPEKYKSAIEWEQKELKRLETAS